MFSCRVYEIFKNLRTTASKTCCFAWSVLLNKYTMAQIDTWFLYHNLQFRLPILPSLLILLILLQSEAVVWWCSTKKVFVRILQNSQEKSCTRVYFLKKLQTYKKRDSGTCFVNSTKFLITPFLKNPLDGCINTFRVFKNNVTSIFRLSIYAAWFEDWEQAWAQYFKPLAWSLFSTQSNICDGAFFAKIVNSGVLQKRCFYEFCKIHKKT